MSRQDYKCAVELHITLPCLWGDLRWEKGGAKVCSTMLFLRANTIGAPHCATTESSPPLSNIYCEGMYVHSQHFIRPAPIARR
jgi:hypothetical protein